MNTKQKHCKKLTNYLKNTTKHNAIQTIFNVYYLNIQPQNKKKKGERSVSHVLTWLYLQSEFFLPFVQGFYL